MMCNRRTLGSIIRRLGIQVAIVGTLIATISSTTSSSRGAVIFIGEDDPTRIDVVGVVIVRQCHRRRRHHHSEDIDGYSNFTMKGAETRGRYWYIGIGCNNETN